MPANRIRGREVYNWLLVSQTFAETKKTLLASGIFSLLKCDHCTFIFAAVVSNFNTSLDFSVMWNSTSVLIMGAATYNLRQLKHFAMNSSPKI